MHGDAPAILPPVLDFSALTATVPSPPTVPVVPPTALSPAPAPLPRPQGTPPRHAQWCGGQYRCLCSLTGLTNQNSPTTEYIFIHMYSK